MGLSSPQVPYDERLLACCSYLQTHIQTAGRRPRPHPVHDIQPGDHAGPTHTNVCRYWLRCHRYWHSLCKSWLWLWIYWNPLWENTLTTINKNADSTVWSTYVWQNETMEVRTFFFSPPSLCLWYLSPSDLFVFHTVSLRQCFLVCDFFRRSTWTSRSVWIRTPTSSWIPVVPRVLPKQTPSSPKMPGPKSLAFRFPTPKTPAGPSGSTEGLSEKFQHFN